MKRLKKYLDYESRVLERRKANYEMLKDVRSAKSNRAKLERLKSKKKLTVPMKKARNKKIAKAYLKSIGNPYRTKI